MTVILIPLVALLPILLLARCSHWAHQTQQKLDETNRHLSVLVNETIKARVEREIVK